MVAPSRAAYARAHSMAQNPHAHNAATSRALPTRAAPGSGLYSAAVARELPWAAPSYAPDALLLTTD